MDKRHKAFFAAVFLLCSVIMLRMLLLSGSGGTILRQEAAAMSRETGQLAAIRGRIFDQHNRLLAWSERCYDLAFHFDPDISPATRHLMQQQIQRYFPDISFPPDFWPYSRVLKYNLTADELAAADQLSNRFPALQVELRWERHCSNQQSHPGEVHQTGEMEVGISGWEAQYDQLLRGKNGTFTVMLDRHGRWIDSTFRITSPPISGRDLYLSEELE